MNTGSHSGALIAGATGVTRSDTPGTIHVARVPADIRPESRT